MAKLSGYHSYMDRLRNEGKLHLWCSCGVNHKVEPNFPMFMKCFCKRYMVLVDKEDMP